MGPKEAFIGGQKFGTEVRAWFEIAVLGLHRGVGGYNTKPFTPKWTLALTRLMPPQGGLADIYIYISSVSPRYQLDINSISS